MIDQDATLVVKPLEWCPKCNASVPNLKRHTCAVRLETSALMPFTADQERRLNELIDQRLKLRGK